MVDAGSGLPLMIVEVESDGVQAYKRSGCRRSRFRRRSHRFTLQFCAASESSSLIYC